MIKPALNIGIVCYPTYGGSGVVATELGIALANEGHQVHFISYKRPARLGPYQSNVYYHEVSPMEYPLFDFKPYDTALTSKIVDVALHQQLDVLHVHYAIPHAIIGFLAREILRSKGKKLPFITTLHGTDITLVGIDGAFFPVVEFSINQSDEVTAVSTYLKDKTLDAFSIQKNIQVVPNFVDLTRFKPATDLRLKNRFASDGEKIICHISNFRKVKRIGDIVHTFFGMQKQIPCKLLLVGDGPERTGLEDLVRELGIAHKVLFLGRQDAVEDILAITDLFMLTSDHESFGLSALEAMACGVPVISSDAGGLKEVNIHGFSGYSYPIGDITQMTTGALDILSTPEKHNWFKANAIQRASDFEIHKVLPMYEDLYRSVLE